MKAIVAGGRDFKDKERLYLEIDVIANNIPITEIVCGCAKGADSLGEEYANDRGIPIKKFPADWDKHGKAAGPIRNGEMAEYGDMLIAFWDGKSRGTANMIEQARNKGLLIKVINYDI